MSVLIWKHNIENLVSIRDEFGSINMDFESFIHNGNLDELMSKLCIWEYERNLNLVHFAILMDDSKMLRHLEKFGFWLSEAIKLKDHDNDYNFVLSVSLENRSFNCFTLLLL